LVAPFPDFCGEGPKRATPIYSEKMIPDELRSNSTDRYVQEKTQNILVLAMISAIYTNGFDTR